MQQHRLLLCFQKLKCPDEQRNIVTVNRSVITQVAPDGHAERCGQCGSCVTGAVAIMFAFGPQKKTVKPAELAHRVKTIEPAGKHFVHVTLVADVHDETVTRGVEHAM